VLSTLVLPALALGLALWLRWRRYR
jgi:hypothetical protein